MTYFYLGYLGCMVVVAAVACYGLWLDPEVLKRNPDQAALELLDVLFWPHGLVRALILLRRRGLDAQARRLDRKLEEATVRSAAEAFFISVGPVDGAKLLAVLTPEQVSALMNLAHSCGMMREEHPRGFDIDTEERRP